MKTAAIAAVTLREVLRRKVQVNLLLFGTLLIGGSFMVSTLTIGEMHRILSDLGLTAMELIGTLLAVFLGATLVAGDVERRVIYPVIVKPVTRTQYLLGRYLGLSLALVLNLLVMAAALAAVLLLEARSLRPLDATLVAALGMLGIQFLVVAAVAVLFSCFTNATLASIFTLSITIAGHLTNDMRVLWTGSTTWIPKLVWYALPNLGSLSLNEAVVYRTPPPASSGWVIMYGFLYAGAAIAVGALVLERRDLR